MEALVVNDLNTLVSDALVPDANGDTNINDMMIKENMITLSDLKLAGKSINMSHVNVARVELNNTLQDNWPVVLNTMSGINSTTTGVQMTDASGNAFMKDVTCENSLHVKELGIVNDDIVHPVKVTKVAQLLDVVDPQKFNDIVYPKDVIQNGYSLNNVQSHATPDTSDTTAWPEFTCGVSPTSGTYIYSGTFRLVNSCTLTNEIELNGELTIIGQTEDMNNLKTINAHTTKRHFKLNGATHKLNLWHVKLTGSDISGNGNNVNSRGGSIQIYINGGELNLYYSEISGNKAKYGGGIYAIGSSDTNRNVIVKIYNSILKDNEATTQGGGAYIIKAVATIEDTIIENNQGNNGGGMWMQMTDATIEIQKISGNEATHGGGAYIHGDSTMLYTSTFTNNDATVNGNEIFTECITMTIVNTIGLSTGIYNVKHQLGTPAPTAHARKHHLQVPVLP